MDREHWNWSIVESTIHEAPERVVERLLEQKPDVVLATCYLFTVDPILGVLERFSTISPGARIVLGGPEFLGENKEFLEKHSFVDAVVRGEAEGVVKRLLEVLEKGRAEIHMLSELAGISFRQINGDIHDDARYAPELLMTELTNPMESPLYCWDKKFVQIETSRGCRSVCSFCTSAVSSGGSGRMISVDDVRKQLQHIREKGVTHVRLLDRTFNHPKERATELIAMFLKEFSDLHFHLEIYPNLVTDEMLELIEAAGPDQLHIEVGIQSTKTEVLSAVRRSLFKPRSHEVVKRLSRIKNVPVHADLIVGLPLQRMEDFLKDLELLSEYLPEEIQVEVLKVLKGTPINQDLQKHGISHAKTPPYEVLQTSTLTFAEIRRCMRLSRLLDHFYNHCEFRTVVCDYWKQNPAFWLELEAFLEGQLDFENPLDLSTRYRWFHSFLQTADVTLANELALVWIRCGHSPLKGLVPASLWKGEIPSEVECLQTTDDFDQQWKRDGKTYHLEFDDHQHWICLYRENQRVTHVLGEWVRSAPRNEGWEMR